MKAYPELERRFGRMANLAGAGAVLHWDWATMMPSGGAEARAEQLAELSLICHEMLTDHGLGDLLDQAEAEGEELDNWQRANLHEMRHHFSHATGVPADLVAALSKATSASEMVWREARPRSDFDAFAKAFKPVLSLVRQKAAAKGEALGCAPYDALIDGYDPGVRMAEIDVVFADLAAFLPDFLAAVLARQSAAPEPVPLVGPFPAEAQRTLGVGLMERLGFDFDHGRLDVSHHPFCGGVSEDVRITTRYDEADFASGLMAVLHETGHALYERGLPKAWRAQPVGNARSMSVHESQSLLIEMQACRSLEFLRFAAPLIRAAFAPHLDVSGAAFEAENLHRLATRVAPGMIRVDADEVTYPAHILLRYRLEKAMLSGELPVDDLPGAWNEGMVELLGVAPANHAEGCLQDIHWAGGDIGYFPSYTLGAMIAAQLFDAACRAEAAIMPGIAAGDFAPLLGWLREAIHGQGSLYSSPALIERATGRRLDAAVFKGHLERRYLT